MTLVNTFLKINNVKVKDFTSHYLSHPNYPSLFAITDTLSLLNIDNVAVKVPKNQFEHLPQNFLAYISDEKETDALVLVQKKKGIVQLTTENNKRNVVSINSFKEKWNEVIIVIEPEKIKEKDINLDSINKIWLVSIILICLFSTNFINSPISSISILNFSLILIGLIISFLILEEMQEKSGDTVSAICSFNENISCNSVLKSDKAKINSWLKFSDLPLIYFGSCALAMILDDRNTYLISLVGIFTIPLLLYSLWLQKSKIKKWCTLCILTTLIILTQGALFFVSNSQLQLNYSTSIISFIVVSIIWFFIKPILENNITLKENSFNLIRFKRNFTVFKSLFKKVKKPHVLGEFSSIEIGNKNSPINLKIILSPSCSHCHAIYSEAIQLLSSTTTNLKLSIFFNINPNNNSNPYLEVAENLLQINMYHPEKIINAIDDWHGKKIGLELWLNKWRQSKTKDEVKVELLKQYNWCLENSFNYTPVKLINNHLFPQEYKIGELKHFLTELNEETKPIALA